jgi:uncharacterized membrane protein
MANRWKTAEPLTGRLNEDVAFRNTDSPDIADHSRAFGRALGIGVVAGLRTATAPASLSRAYRHGAVPLQPGGLLGLLTKRWIGRALPMNAIGEMIVDKTPWVPSRVQPVALIPRLASGAGVGSAIYRGAGRPRWRGAILGAVGALLGSFAGNHARRFATKATKLPDLLFAVAEDAFAVGSARLLLRRPRFGMLLAVAAAVIAFQLRPGAATDRAASAPGHAE